MNARVFDGTVLQDWASVRFVDRPPTERALASAAHYGDDVIDAAGSDYLKVLSGTGGLWPAPDSETIEALVHTENHTERSCLKTRLGALPRW